MRVLLLLTLGLTLVAAAACGGPPNGSKQESSARSAPDFGGVEIVEVETSGVGPTRNAAILDALNLAVRQTNGTPIQGVTQNLNGSLALGGKSGDFGITLDNVSAMTRGAVKNFEIVRERNRSGNWTVSVKAKVAKFKDPAASGMPKVTVAAARVQASSFQIGDQTLSSREASAAVRSAVADAVVQSNRFFVINRDFDQDLDAEAVNITNGDVNPAELVKLGQRLTADIIILPEIRRLEYRKSSRNLRFSGRELRSYAGGADISFNVLNVATGQLILTKRYSVEFPATPPTVNGAQAVEGGAVQVLLAGLANQFTREFIQKNFPVSVIKMQGATVTLSQGEGAVRVGDAYEVISLGEEMTDPQTGQSLGRAEIAAGSVTVTQVMEKVSVGTYRGSFDAGRFKPGVLELRPSASRTPAQIATAPSAAPAALAAKAGPAVSATRPPPVASRKSDDNFDKDFEF